MSEERPKDSLSELAPEAPDVPAPSLRESEVAPKRKPLAEILEGLPAAPGVYIMKDHRGKTVYIGKAAVLRNRVRQYFQPASGDSRDFVPLLEGIVADIETVITSNEKEALLLENTLIKKHQPRFNVNLKDDKNYLVLRLDPAAEWPRLEVVRKLGDDGASYFGPYHSATSCREALRVVNRHFQLRTCTDHVLHNRRRPCLQYQIKRCPAPCVLPVASEAYAEQVRDVGLFLDGKSDELMDRLRGRMKDAAGRTDFEVAADIRDQVRALEVTLEEQRVVSADFCDQDVIGFHREGIALEIVVMSIRGGKLSASRAFSFTGQEFPDAELLSSFIGLYYDLGAPPPDEVLLPVDIEDAAHLLPDDRSALIEYVVAEGRTLMFVLSRKGAAAAGVDLHVYTIAIPASTLARRVQDFRRQLAERNLAIRASGAELFNLLFGSARRQLAGKTAFIVVPDGALWDLPVVYVCENNLYATEMAFCRATKNTSVASRGDAYCLPGVEVDGQDVMAVHEAAKYAIHRAREGGGPTLIECKTYRFVGHHEGDPGTDYRTREEVQQWKQRDPLKRSRKLLLDLGADEKELQAVDQEVELLIDQAVEFAQGSSEPLPGSVNDHVF